MMLNTVTGETKTISEDLGAAISQVKEAAEHPQATEEIKQKAEQFRNVAVFHKHEIISIKGGTFKVLNFGKKQMMLEALPRTEMRADAAFSAYLKHTTPEQRALVRQVSIVEGEIVNCAIAFKKSGDATALNSAIDTHQSLLTKIESLLNESKQAGKTAEAEA